MSYAIHGSVNNEEHVIQEQNQEVCCFLGDVKASFVMTEVNNSKQKTFFEATF